MSNTRWLCPACRVPLFRYYDSFYCKNVACEREFIGKRKGIEEKALDSKNVEANTALDWRDFYSSICDELGVSNPREVRFVTEALEAILDYVQDFKESDGTG